MKKHFTVLVLISSCLSTLFATSFIRRTLDQKVASADLIVTGKATTTGTRTKSAIYNYERDLTIDVDQVLWPPSIKEIKNLTFRYGIIETWPREWWDYSNTPGIFFLVDTNETLYDKSDIKITIVSSSHDNVTFTTSNWTRLERYNDWMEALTNANLVEASIKKIKQANNTQEDIRR